MKYISKFKQNFNITSRTRMKLVSATIMQLTNLPFSITTNIDTIYKEIGIDAEKVESTLKLIRDWLKCESYLPEDVDEVLLRNFILGCKGNLEKTKEKLEKYIVAKTKLKRLYDDRAIKMEDFTTFPHHRLCYISPKQTPEGHRVIMFRMPQKDPSKFEHHKFVKYICLFWDLLLLNDTSAGYHFIYDIGWFSPQYLAKMNLALLKQLSELMYNVLPFRIRSLMLLNENTTVQVVMNIGKAFMSKKLTDRIFSAKIEDLPKYHLKDYLPVEYGGTQGLFNDNCDQTLELLKENSKWCQQTEKLKLTGPVPQHKKNSHSFEDFNMDGSFRKLGFD